MLQTIASTGARLCLGLMAALPTGARAEAPPQWLDADRILYFNDPFADQQWALRAHGENGATPGQDLNLQPVYAAGYSGAGVTIAIVDGGVSVSHPDLNDNYSGLALNLNGGSASNPNPVNSVYSNAAFFDLHGTTVAGIAVAEGNNGAGALGVAYEAEFAVVRLLASSVSDSQIAQALNFSSGVVDIYNNSWSASDAGILGQTEPGATTRLTIQNNASTGRGGLGNIYVFTAGNDRGFGSRSAYNGYGNLPETIVVGAVDENGLLTNYSEEGPNVFVVAPSGSDTAAEGVITTDVPGTSGGDFLGFSPGSYYQLFSGTSAAAPQVSGVIALMLEANPNLSWRDVQHILARTSTPVHINAPGWQVNAAGFRHHQRLGFGRINAAGAVALAQEWPGAGTVTQVNQPGTGAALTSGVTRQFTLNMPSSLFLENVVLNLNLSGLDIGDVTVRLISPSGSSSTFLEPSALPFTTGSYKGRTVRHWGETSNGTWTLEVTATAGGGSVSSWSIDVYGTAQQPGNNQLPTVPEVTLEAGEDFIVFDPRQGASDPDGDPLRVLSVQGQGKGIYQLLPGGNVRYRMRAEQEGTDVLQVLISDGEGGARMRRISLVGPLIHAGQDWTATVQGQSAYADLLRNDSPGSSFTWVNVSDPELNKIVGLGGPDVRYDSVVGNVPFVRLPHTINDGNGNFRSGWLNIHIAAAEGDLALDFPGGDSRVQVENLGGAGLTNNFTWEAWIRPENAGSYRVSVDLDNNSSQDVVSDVGWGHILDAGTGFLFINGYDDIIYPDASLVFEGLKAGGATFAAYSPAGSIRFGEWQHVAVSLQAGGTGLRMFIDGVEVAVTLDGTVGALDANAADPIYIGNSTIGNGSFEGGFEGQMGEVRLWSNVRTPTQIATNRNVRLNGSETGLRAWFDFGKSRPDVFTAGGTPSQDAEIFQAVWTLRDAPERAWQADTSGGYGFGDGMMYSDLLGWFDTVYAPFFDHLDLSLFSLALRSGDTLWLAHQRAELGWLYTTTRAFPWMYSVGAGEWRYLLEINGQYIYFYRPTPPHWIRMEKP